MPAVTAVTNPSCIKLPVLGEYAGVGHVDTSLPYRHAHSGRDDVDKRPDYYQKSLGILDAAVRWQVSHCNRYAYSDTPRDVCLA